MTVTARNGHVWGRSRGVVRLFIGIPIPVDSRINQVTHALRQQEKDAKPVPPGTWHVTLRFLGEVADPRTVEDALYKVVAKHSAMKCQIKGLGAFQGPKRARIVWVKVLADGLRELAQDITKATAHLGEPATQDFVAHATMARLPTARDISSFIDHHKDTVLGEGVLDKVILYRSQLTKVGPIYQRLAEIPLQASA